MLQKNFFSQKRFIYYFGENAAQRAETDVDRTKAKIAIANEKTLNEELKGNTTIEAILGFINKQIDEKIDEQIKKLKPFEKELGNEKFKELIDDLKDFADEQKKAILDDYVFNEYRKACEALKAIHSSSEYPSNPEIKLCADKLEAKIRGMRIEKFEEIDKKTPERTGNFKIILFNRYVTVIVPPEHKIKLDVAERIFKNLESRTDLNPYITDQTQFQVEAGSALSFKIQKPTKELKYIVTAHEVLKVVKERDPNWREKYAELNLEQTTLSLKLKNILKHDKSLKPEQRALIDQYLEENGNDYQSLKTLNSVTYQAVFKLLHVITKNDNYKLKLAPEYRRMIDEIQSTGEKMVALERDRELVDDNPNDPSKHGIKIRDELTFNSSSLYIVKYETGLGRTYDEDGLFSAYMSDPKTDKTKYSWRYEKDKKVTENVFDEKGIKTSTHFDESGKAIFKRTRLSDDEKEHLQEIIGEHGETVSTFKQEKLKNPKLSTDQYLKMLASILNTPERWAAFLENFMEYTFDSDDKNNPLKAGTKESRGDYWQTAEETIAREEKHKMRGDCDDYAYLILAILKLQGKNNAQVIFIPNHALCVWTEKRPDGRYDAYSLCTFGYDKNGTRLGMEPDPSKPQNGYATITEALNALMAKYKQEGKGVEHSIDYKVDEYIEVGTTPDKGKALTCFVPVEALIHPELVEYYLKLTAAQENKDIVSEEKILIEITTKYPNIKSAQSHLVWLYGTELDNLLDSKKTNMYSLTQEIIDSDPRLLELLKKYTDIGEKNLNDISKNWQFNYLYIAQAWLGEKAKAKTALEKAVQKDTDSSFIYLNLMTLYEKDKNLEMINAIYKKMRANCKDIPARNLMLTGIIFDNLGDYKKFDELNGEAAMKATEEKKKEKAKQVPSKK